MSLMIIPEFILHRTLTGVLKYIRDDYQAQSDKSKAWISLVLQDVAFERYDLREQALAVFLGPIDDPRTLSIELMFNMKRKGSPSIHITLPAEQSAANGNGLGQDQGYEDDFIVEGTVSNPDSDPVIVGVPGQDRPVFTRRYSAIYNVVVTSDNSTEVILIFHVLKAMLTAAAFTLDQNNIQQMSLGGQDIQPYNELANNLFMRACSVSIQYDTSTPAIPIIPIPNGVIVDGVPVEEISEP